MRLFMRLLLGTALLALIMLGASYAFVEYSANTPVGAKGEQKVSEIHIPKGATLNHVGRMLEETGHIQSALVWKVYVRIHGGPSPKAGRHSIHTGMTVPALLRTLSENPIPDEVPLTMVEGWRLVDADAFLSAQAMITAGAYKKAAENPKKFSIPFPFTASSLEGYLYPETYMVPVGPVDVDQLIQRQIEFFNERFYRPHEAEIKSSGYSLHDLVVMASMLEREEPTPAQRPMVAGVLYKRLKKKFPLGVDATSRYRLVNWNDRPTFLKALRNPDEPYNTRLRVGLPPGPIGAPGVESLVAALRPKDSEYWYYLHDMEKKIHFSRTAKEHERYRKKYDIY